VAEQTLVCQTCGKKWIREARGGRRPTLCAECKEDPLQLKKKKELDTEAVRRAAASRIDNLEKNLRANNSSLDSKRPRRSYSMAEFEERLHQLEERVKALEEEL